MLSSKNAGTKTKASKAQSYSVIFKKFTLSCRLKRAIAASKPVSENHLLVPQLQKRRGRRPGHDWNTEARHLGGGASKRRGPVFGYSYKKDYTTLGAEKGKGKIWKLPSQYGYCIKGLAGSPVQIA